MNDARPTRAVRFHGGWMLGVLCTMGCGDGPQGWMGTVRDSAGITIVENLGPGSWAQEDQWRVVADLTIGSADGPDEFVFARLADVAVDGTGNMYVLDQQAQELRMFDREGGFVRTFGRGGEGPGELSRFTTDVLTTATDTVYVADYGQSRINVYTESGVGTINVPSPPIGRQWVFAGPGQFVYRAVSLSRDEAGRFRTWDGLMRFDIVQQQVDTLMVFEYEQTEIGSREALRIPLIVNAPFWTRLDDGRLIWSSLEKEWIQLMDESASLEAIVSSDFWVAREPTAADQAAMKELLRQKLEMLGGDASAADFPNVDMPSALPAITGVRSGPDGTIWVQRMGDPVEIEPMAINANDRSEWLGGSVWDVLDGSGKLLGSIQLPGRFRITRITEDAVYGIGRGTDDVEQVVRLRLERGGP